MQLAFDIETITTARGVAENTTNGVVAFKSQLLKWIGNKQRLAPGIISFFPKTFGTYHEPFLGSGGVLGVLAPRTAEASDIFRPLVGIWQQLRTDPEVLVSWYRDRYEVCGAMGKVEGYEHIKANYNRSANAADLLFLSRSCYGGVVRFRMKDGYMSTPCGVHAPISPASFRQRVSEWGSRVAGTTFHCRDYTEALERARAGDVVYCDPPYTHTQAILYGAQRFDLQELFRSIEAAKQRGVFVALSIDGSKKSGAQDCAIAWPKKLFEREVSVDVGRSMLRRFQMEGRSLETELVRDRLLLTH